ncbi:hypothetical protein KZ483_10540 [Paenibacillus sp. sptzw28]|uniref:hypothetical protein n=1 Tax=Paenibacillus sp. sptzw28 TaxID=715179 RepID=UPI001C6E3051|nr:hypothetical protein [Paenibacillus sp. sptzw28]QYR23308.1 hypothetical protein KZ483_10540 [Paenibacillus sp. sptzw28]
MDLIMDQEFDNETIVFDGFHFIGCSFTKCIIIITSPDFAFDRCSFKDTAFHVDPALSAFQIAQTFYPDSTDSWTGISVNETPSNLP